MTSKASPPWQQLFELGERDGRLVFRSFQGEASPLLAPLPADLHPELLKALRARGIDQLYSHQAEALEAAWRQTTIVTTGTASGKSLCFNLPTLDVLCRDKHARALYLYPTKALAQDQARALLELKLGKLLRPAIYDGDTPKQERAQIRKNANLILTNPDMLHVGILPHHPLWGNFFSNLAFVVIDEAHVYRGVFGSNVANVLRRLRRIANAYGTEPRFLLASATIANPRELAQRLTGVEEIELVDRDGSPAAPRDIGLWNPPLLDEDLGLRGSPLAEAVELIAHLVQRNVRTICFIKSRKGVELIAQQTAQRLRSTAPELADRVAPYRSGYTPQQRRELERRLMSGELHAVVATDALELGIDIGSLDCAVCVTFPGTVASLRQMWGRAGRRDRGLALFVAGQDALDQFFSRHPEQFLQRPVEAAILDHRNEQIYTQHLLCAAHEGPLAARDAETLGSEWQQYADQLVTAGELVKSKTGYIPRRRDHFPAGNVSLRSASADTFSVIDVEQGELIGTVESARAYSTLHPGAVYLHLGRSYGVQALEIEQRQAFVAPFAGDWYTQPKRDTTTVIEERLMSTTACGVKLEFGTVAVTERVLGYQRKHLTDQQVVDFQALQLPESTFTTQALWYQVEHDLLEEVGVGEQALLGALHAVEHSQIAVLPLLAMCDRWDIGGLSTNFHQQTGEPTIFIYDGFPGGVGITRLGFTQFETLVADARRLIEECPCKDGCPSCVQSPKCGNLNEPLAKEEALLLLRRMSND